MQKTLKQLEKEQKEKRRDSFRETERDWRDKYTKERERGKERRTETGQDWRGKERGKVWTRKERGRD